MTEREFNERMESGATRDIQEEWSEQTRRSRKREKERPPAILIRMTAEQRQYLNEAAIEAGKSLQAYCLAKLLLERRYSK